MSKDLTQGDIPKALFDLAWPMTIGILAIMAFNLADTFFVGQLGTKELAAMSMTFPVVMVVMTISFGISVALSSLVSREIGAGNWPKVKSITTDGLIMATVTVSLITCFGLLTMDPMFRLLGAEGETLDLVKRYMRIWYFNVFFLVVPMVGNGAIRATGDTRSPAAIMVVAGVLNIILDPLLIFGIGPFPRMELEGAALATVFSRICTLIAGVYLLHFREKLLVRPFQDMKEFIAHWKDLSAVAIPAASGSAIVPVSMFVVTAMVANYGDDVIAGFGVGTRIESILTVMLFGVSAGLGPFVGQNYGAHNFPRVSQAMHNSHLAILIWISLASIAIFLGVDSLASIFSDNLRVQSVAATYAKIIVISLFFQGVHYNINSALNAIGNAKLSFKLIFLRMIVLYLPIAFLLRFYFQENGVFAAAFLANTIAGIVAYQVFRLRYRKCVL